MGTVEIVCADVLEWAETYTGEPFHAMLCDPPYELNFMSKGWDNTGIAFQPSTWAALAAHLLPGAWLMAFASSRGWHRLAVAIEDAGMIIQPSIFGWANGQSFPKASRIDTQIDKAAGKLEEREVIGLKRGWERLIAQAPDGKRDGKGTWGDEVGRSPYLEKAATPLARAWEGHRYGGQVLKDALNPIICAQKPWEGRRLDCIVETGAGALNVEGGRVNSNGRPAIIQVEIDGDAGACFGKGLASGTKKGIANGTTMQGRWPPNLYLQHSPLCQARGTRRVKANHSGGTATRGQSAVWDGCQGQARLYSPGAELQRTHHADASGLETVSRFACEIQCQDCGHTWVAEERGPCVECEGDGEWVCAVRKLGEQSGERGSQGVKTLGSVPNLGSKGIYGKSGRVAGNHPGDAGTASRFFPNPDWSLEVAETLAGADPVRYQAKASRAERDAGLDEFERKQDAHNLSSNACARCGLRVKANGSGDKCECGELRETIKLSTTTRNPHPTVKPLSLNKWLATLLLPPPEYAPRRLLVPFGGVCSEAIGALLAGWEHITVIEMSQEYCDIGKSRVKFWQGWSEQTGLTEPKAILKAHRKAVKKAANAPAPQQVTLQL